MKFEFLAQLPDSTALIGQYPQGNEPSFHIPYLYNYAGAPWKTQKHLREIMQVWYAAQPLGLPGDDDSGATTSWYVFSSMGFYPVTPGRPVYDIGSPTFSASRIQLQSGKSFRILAHNVSAANKYIQSATLNGHPLNQPWFSHSELMRGGSLVLEMGPHPNKAWGSRISPEFRERVTSRGIPFGRSRKDSRIALSRPFPPSQGQPRPGALCRVQAAAGPAGLLILKSFCTARP